MFQVSSLFGNALSLSAHEHINIQTIIIQKYRITSMADQIYLLTDFKHIRYNYILIPLITSFRKLKAFSTKIPRLRIVFLRSDVQSSINFIILGRIQ